MGDFETFLTLTIPFVAPWNTPIGGAGPSRIEVLVPASFHKVLPVIHRIASFRPMCVVHLGLLSRKEVRQFMLNLISDIVFFFGLFDKEFLHLRLQDLKLTLSPETLDLFGHTTCFRARRPG